MTPNDKLITSYIHRGVAEKLMLGRLTQTEGPAMQCQIKQEINDQWSAAYPVHRLIEEGFGIWSPFVVSRQVEHDFLTGLCLMYGKDPAMVLLDGRDENNTGYPPTFLQIPELSQ